MKCIFKKIYDYLFAAHTAVVGDFHLAARVVIFTDGRLTDFTDEDAIEQDEDSIPKHSVKLLLFSLIRQNIKCWTFVALGAYKVRRTTDSPCRKNLLDTFWCARFELLTFSGKIPKQNKFFICGGLKTSLKKSQNT